MVSKKYRMGYQGSEMDNEVKGDGNSYTTEFRQLDPRLGRWLSIDPKATSFASSSPYVSMGDNPICFNDTKGDSVPTQFYDESGNAMTVVPDRVQKMYNEEYGITVGYNAATGMMYQSGTCSTTLSVSPIAKKAWEDVLNDKNSSDILIFGYNLGNQNTGDITRPVAWGVSWGSKTDINKPSTVEIDLADFNSSDESLVGHVYGGQKMGWGSMEIPVRTYNLARVVEHEFLGHGILNYKDDHYWGNNDENYSSAYQNDFLLGNPIRDQLNLPIRMNYEFFTFSQNNVPLAPLTVNDVYIWFGQSYEIVPCPLEEGRDFPKPDKYGDCYGGIATKMSCVDQVTKILKTINTNY